MNYKFQAPFVAITFWQVKVVIKSISNGVKYLILHNKNGWRTSNICQFDSRKWFWLSIIVQVAMASKRFSIIMHLKKK
jgi:hypothetical protein